MKTLNVIFSALVLVATSTSTSQAASWAPTRVHTQVLKNERYAISHDTQGDCKVGSECKVTLKIEASSAFHVNKDFPFKFKANEIEGVTFTGTDAAGKNVFSKAAGDFAMDAKTEKIGYLTLHFKPTKAGTVTIAGGLKLCVCDANNCKPESQDLSLSVVVK